MAEQKVQTLCWCCAKATGGCRWSDRLRPVPGWEATEVRHSTGYNIGKISYVVHYCPQFERDAVRDGLLKYDPTNPLHKAINDNWEAMYGSKSK